MSPKTFNVAIAGYGFSAKVFHIPFIQQVPSLKLYGILQRNPSPDSNASHDFPSIKTWNAIDSMLSDTAIDLVVITTPVTSHVPLTKAVLEAGKHVVVEKPFTATAKEARELTDLAKQKGRVLSVYQNRRWDADFVTVRQLLESGRLGRIVELEMHIDRFQPERKGVWQEKPQPGVGMVYDVGSHMLDQVVHGLGLGLPKRVSGFVGFQRLGATMDNDADDSFTAFLQYEGGLIVTVKSMVLSADDEQLRFWIRGAKGSFKKYHLDCQEEHLLAGKKVDQEGFGAEPEDRFGTITIDQNGKLTKSKLPTVKPPTWAEYYRLLAKALAGEGNNPVTGNQATQIIDLIEKIKASSAEGRSIPM